MHQEYVYVLTLVKAISYKPAFVPAEESPGCFQTPGTHPCSLNNMLLHWLSAGKIQPKKHN